MKAMLFALLAASTIPACASDSKTEAGTGNVDKADHDVECGGPLAKRCPGSQECILENDRLTAEGHCEPAGEDSCSRPLSAHTPGFLVDGCGEWADCVEDEEGHFCQGESCEKCDDDGSCTTIDCDGDGICDFDTAECINPTQITGLSFGTTEVSVDSIARNQWFRFTVTRSATAQPQLPTITITEEIFDTTCWVSSLVLVGAGTFGSETFEEYQFQLESNAGSEGEGCRFQVTDPYSSRVALAKLDIDDE